MKTMNVIALRIADSAYIAKGAVRPGVRVSFRPVSMTRLSDFCRWQ